MIFVFVVIYSQRLDDIYKDKQPHLYTLIVRPDNTFSVLVDSKEVNSGSLLEDFTPAVNPPEEIDDPNDIKPEEWDEREKVTLSFHHAGFFTIGRKAFQKAKSSHQCFSKTAKALLKHARWW